MADNAELRAAWFRFQAARARMLAARLDLAAAVVQAQASMQGLSRAIVASEAREVARHPDLAELNVAMDGFYGPIEASG